MARLVLVLALCVLPALVSAEYIGDPFSVHGSVYCDTCRCGYETYATTRIPGAKVKIECQDRDTQNIKFRVGAVTDSNGSYTITIPFDHGDDYCDAVLVSSPLADCAEPDLGRDRSRVILTRNNGCISNVRYANALGFKRNVPLSSCPQVLQKYQEAEE